MYRQARAVLNDLGHSVRAALSSSTSDGRAARRRPGRGRARDPGRLRHSGADGGDLLPLGWPAILARAVRAQGRDDEALELTRAAEAAAADDDVDAQVLWRGIRAPILARAGDPSEAEALVRAALERARQTEMPSLHAFALAEFGAVLHLANGRDEARAR